MCVCVIVQLEQQRQQLLTERHTFHTEQLKQAEMKVRQQREPQGQPGYPTQHSGLQDCRKFLFSDILDLHVSSTRPPSGQPMSNRMLPGGGNAQPMATRHPGAPNGMCEHSRPTRVPSLVHTSLCCSSAHPVSSLLLADPDGAAPAHTPVSSHS